MSCTLPVLPDSVSSLFREASISYRSAVNMSPRLSQPVEPCGEVRGKCIVSGKSMSYRCVGVFTSFVWARIMGESRAVRSGENVS